MGHDEDNGNVLRAIEFPRIKGGKPFDIDALVIAIDRAVQHRALREEVKRLRRAVEQSRSYGALIGQSQAIENVRALLARVSSASSSPFGSSP